VLTVEQGVFGGVPLSGPEGGAGFNYQALIDQPYMFDFYDGGGLDVASLSFAEVDAEGNVNVHAFEGRVRGPGGFPNISARTPRINFVGTLTAQGLELDISGDGVRVVRDYDPAVPAIEGYPGDLVTVWTNLLANAPYGRGEGGTLRLRTGADGDSVRV
jgi:acyl CoA:acetate/3-ketoacid CoA transferase